MKLEVITTGEEVLSGQIVDTNAAWLADLLMAHGFELQRRSTVGDRLEDLVGIFRERSRHADLILVNGGLGPTSDDLTVEAVARAMDEPLVENLPWREHLEDWFRRRGRAMPASNLKQCLLPRSAILVDNPAGSAPGFRARLGKAWLFCTPGVPSEFKRMAVEQFLPFLRKEFGQREEVRLHRLLTLGHGESSLAERLSSLTLPEGVTLGYRPTMPHVEIKLFARGPAAAKALEDCAARVREHLGEAVVAENAESIASTVHNLLQNQGLRLGVAESLTGGMLSSSLVDYPGSSTYLQHGLVAYSEAAKQALLGVSAETLESFGAVSLETAREMALGARRLHDCDLALATTGVAGPQGGSETLPVGTVCLALADRHRTWTQRVQLGNRSRDLVRQMSCAVALDMLRRRVLEHEPVVDYPFITRSALRVFEE